MGNERCSRSKSRSRSRSPTSKSRRKSKSPSAAKKRGRPRTRPIISPSKKRKVGRPKRGIEVATPNILSVHDHRGLDSQTMPKTLSKNKVKGGRDSEDEAMFDPNYIEPTTRVLRNQAEIDTARAQCKRSDPTKIMTVYNAKMNNPQEYNKNTMENNFDVARLMFITPVNYFQDTFQGQEFVRLSIKRKLIKHLVEISWSLIKGSQLHYNILNPYYPKFDGVISIDEEFHSFMQLENYVDEDHKVLSEQEYENAFYEKQNYEYHAADDINDDYFDELFKDIMPESQDIIDV